MGTREILVLTWFWTSGRSPFRATNAFLTTSRRAFPVLVPLPLYGIRSTASSRSDLFFTSDQFFINGWISMRPRLVWVGLVPFFENVPDNLRICVTFLLNEIIPILTVSWPTSKYSAKDFKNFRTNAKLSSPIELDASTTKYKSNLKSRGQPDPKIKKMKIWSIQGGRGQASTVNVDTRNRIMGSVCLWNRPNWKFLLNLVKCPSLIAKIKHLIHLFEAPRLLLDNDSPFQTLHFFHFWHEWFIKMTHIIWVIFTYPCNKMAL